MTLPNHPMKFIIGVAILFHLLLFTIAKPIFPKKQQAPMPPTTTYLSKRPNSTDPLNKLNIWSPLLFSLPSEMGFSHDYLEQKLQTHLTLPPPEKTNYFLHLSPQQIFATFIYTGKKRLLTHPETTPLPLPADPSLTPPPPSTKKAPRIRLSQTLKPRLDLPQTLPPLLNQPTPNPWEAHATIKISAYGRVEQIFLRKPIEDPQLNKAVLLWLYNLHFKPADQPETGTLELFSPAPKTEEEQ